MVRPMTSGSERFFAISSKPLVGMKQAIRRWIDIVEAHLSLIRYGLTAVSNLLNRGILFFKFFKIFGIVFAPVFEPFVRTRRVIRRWKAMNEVQLSYVEIFLRFLTVLS